MKKYLVLRDMPGFKEGELFSGEEIVKIHNYCIASLQIKGWIQEIEEEESLKDKILKVLIFLTPDISKMVAEIARDHYAKKFDESWDVIFSTRWYKEQLKNKIFGKEDSRE